MIFLPCNKALIPYARILRRTLTVPENIIWQHIRKGQILKIQFYRQKIIGNYIVDFFASAIKLVIEIDGPEHYEPDGIEQDLSRDAYLNELGLCVLRFSNKEVQYATTSVIEKIVDYAKENLR